METFTQVAQVGQVLHLPHLAWFMKIEQSLSHAGLNLSFHFCSHLRVLYLGLLLELVYSLMYSNIARISWIWAGYKEFCLFALLCLFGLSAMCR